MFLTSTFFSFDISVTSNWTNGTNQVQLLTGQVLKTIEVTQHNASQTCRNVCWIQWEFTAHKEVPNNPISFSFHFLKWNVNTYDMADRNCEVTCSSIYLAPRIMLPICDLNTQRKHIWAMLRNFSKAGVPNYVFIENPYRYSTDKMSVASKSKEITL